MDIKEGDIVYHFDKKGIVENVRGGGLDINFEGSSYLNFFMWHDVSNLLSKTPYIEKIVRENYTPL